jgi:signal transduction histidine kinase
MTVASQRANPRPTWKNALITTGLAFVLATALHDGLVATDLIAHTSTTWPVFGPPVMLACVVLAMRGRWFGAFDEAGRLNRELEHRVAERARDIERQYEHITTLQRRSAVAEERERLMRDMHDGVGSQLMATLNAFERGQLPSAQVGELLRQCIEDLRLVIDSLDAGEHNLVAALANLRYRLEPRLTAAGLELGWDVDPQAGTRLAPGAVLHVLRVVQEALYNAMKHAQATRLGVRAIDEAATGTLCVEVTDDGIGTLAATPTVANTAGRGLDNMRQRARSLGGELELVAQARGTCVRLRILSDSRTESEAQEFSMRSRSDDDAPAAARATARRRLATVRFSSATAATCGASHRAS